jgi:hypothetical protein
MASDGASIKEIRRKTGYSRKLIRAALLGQRSDIFRAGKARLSLGSHGWTNNGRRIGGTAPNSGAISSGRAFSGV